MNRAKSVAYLLVVFLAVSIGFNTYQYIQSINLANQNNETSTKMQMSTLLSQAQVNVSSKLEQLATIIQSACAQLSTTDLKGSEARNILSAVSAGNSLIVNAATSDVHDILLAVEPEQYSSIEGEDISSQKQNIQMHQTMQPAMSDMILLVEGFYGVVMVAPIFNFDGTFIGALSLVIQPYDLLKSVIVPSIDGTPYSMWAMQTNGTLLYDPDPVQQGKNLFTDPIYVDYPTVQAFVHQVAGEEAGYGTYQYHENTVAGNIVNKEAYWTTTGIYGAQWRLVLLHVLDS